MTADAWIAPTVSREDPAQVSDERTALEQWLEFHRATLLGKCAGLTSDQLKTRAVAPSGLSLLGLVRHMLEVERWWFRMHAAREDLQYRYVTDEDEDAEFNGVDDADAAADIDAYRQECDAARAAVAGLPLDHVVPTRGHRADVTLNLRWIYLHMIEEYARHNGHADLLRERIDGSTGF